MKSCHHHIHQRLMHLQGMAMHAAVTERHNWWSEHWASVLLEQPSCSGAKKRFDNMVEQNAPVEALLAQLHICMRHVMAHKGFSVDIKEVVDAYPFASVADISAFLKATMQDSSSPSAALSRAASQRSHIAVQSGPQTVDRLGKPSPKGLPRTKKPARSKRTSQKPGPSSIFPQAFLAQTKYGFCSRF